LKKSKKKISLKYSEIYFYSENSTSAQYSNNTCRKKYFRDLLVDNKDYLLTLLFSLGGVIQSAKYHPESDALYHSLQVFELAYQQSNDPELWLAALFHDVGKAIDSKQHSKIGAEMLFGIFPYRILWLIEHHLDLMIFPKRTQQRLANTQQLSDLIKLRSWDIKGRSPSAIVRSPEAALNLIFDELNIYE